MIPAVRFLGIALFAALLSFPALAADPWDGAPLSADPKALLAAAEQVPAGEADVVVLLDEATHTFDEKGRSVSEQRMVYRIVAESAIDTFGSVNAPWAPWYQEKPVIQARVVTKDGTVHSLDGNAVIEAPAPEESLDIFSDNRVIRAPLPAVAVGSVVEQHITWKSKESLYDAASSDVFFFGGFQPTHRSRFIVDAPLSLPLHFVNRSTIQPRKEEKDGRQRVVFEGGPHPAKDDLEWNLPFDVAPLPWVGVSTASSWQDLAKRYTEIVDKQIASSPELEKQLREAIGDAKERREVIAKALAWIQKRVRYAGVEVGESSVVPRPPQTVLSNRYGDCKDKATLLVALLRLAGLDAHVALLRAGEDFDVPSDLPGLGMFNHAIVVVDGETPLWVDPTDEYARAGELPLMDQGRLALIARPATTALVATPVSESTANRVTETRTFVIPEEGKATLTEITEGTGADDSSLRRYWVSNDRKRYRESMEEYVKRYYAAKALSKLEASDAHDLTKPFRIEIAATEAGRGVAIDGEAAVAIFPTGLLESVPWALRDVEDENDTAEQKARKQRKNDFVFTRPMVREWKYRIVPPAGFVPRTLPANETTKIGTMSLTREFTADADGTVNATLRFDTGKRRLTPSEVEETRKAFKEAASANPIMVGFDQRGQLELTKGNIAGALAEFRKLAAAHAKEGRHQVEIAKALLAGGMGDAAREQIKKAIALEPKYARAHRMQGIILQHDLFGRPYRKGADLAGAVAAYRKAKELDPKDESIRAELAKLLEYGEDGLLFGRNANLAAAIDEYRSLIKELDDKSYEPELFLALARARRWDELREAIANADNAAQKSLWTVVAAGATSGSQDAIRAAAAGDQSQRKELLRNAATVLLTMRMYERAADLFEEAMQGAPTAEARQQVEGLRKAKRIEEVSLPADDPKSVVRKLAADALMFELNADTARKFYAADEVEFFGSDSQQAEWRTMHYGLLSIARQQGLPLEFYADVGLGSVQMAQEGDDETGYRIRMRAPAARGGNSEEMLFVIKEKGEYRISGSRKSPGLIGFSVLRLLDAGKNEAARQWLNWTREEFSAGGDDPLAGTPFARYWPKAKQSATPEEMRVAAAMLMPSKELGARAVTVLGAAREKATSDQHRLAIDHALAITHMILENSAAGIPIAERLLAAVPESAVAFNLLVGALTRAERNDDITKIANERLARMPKDPDALRALAGAAMNAGDYASCDKYYRQVVDDLRPNAGDYNNIAWNALLSGLNLDRALEDARQAMQLPGANAALLHTLASLYAETGKSLEAREALFQSMDDAGREEPAPHDWYVLGRIAENYGATDAALAAYKRVEKPKTGLASSTYVLAERRVKALGVRQR